MGKKMQPKSTNGIICDATIVTGTIAIRALSGAYAFACWMSCPVSCAAMPSAATEGV